ncbi:enoyl-CoA hydratase-related protein [Acetobacteraceae bacterium KSS8]|uniref:Enoyl-CoA hydratase-related protein n=1 Tax=Endosaccharibacter trunci TaxID=2812733 RepID=A0ABT1W7X3_9PROT|nr:enoyl-CoA hydratase-related protein [Acetobacteraceae bacterium KSS8]
MTDVRASKENGVLHLVMDRPGKKNALTGAMYHALSDGLDRAAGSDSIRAVLISGAGDAFSAGNDVADFLSSGASTAADAPSVRFILALTRFSKPLVAAVQGNAVGIGTTMLLHCDLVFADETARFATPFSKLGLVPEAGSSLLLPARIGAVRANAMLLLGETLDANAALSAGLVNAVLPAGTVLDHARKQAETLAALPPAALRASKALIQGDRSALEARIDAELKAFGVALRSEEARAAFNLFLSRPKS